MSDESIYHQNVYVMTNTEHHPFQCDYRLEWCHYTLDCLTRTFISNLDNNSKEHNHFEVLYILKPIYKSIYQYLNVLFVKWLLVPASFASSFE